MGQSTSQEEHLEEQGYSTNDAHQYHASHRDNESHGGWISDLFQGSVPGYSNYYANANSYWDPNWPPYNSSQNEFSSIESQRFPNVPANNSNPNRIELQGQPSNVCAHNCNLCEGCYFKRADGRDLTYINLHDGRRICSLCYKYSKPIMDRSSLQNLVSMTRKFYKGLNLKVNKRIPIFLTDSYQIQKRTTGTFGDHICGVTEFYLKGGTIKTIERSSLDRNNIQVVKGERRSTSSISILLLFGNPEFMTGATLAHEMMHAWLALEAGLEVLQKLTQEVHEGICQVMAYKWMEWYSSKYLSNSEQDRFVRNLIKEYKDAFGKTTIFSEVMCNGFLSAKIAVDTYGLEDTLKQIIGPIKKKRNG